LQFRSRGQRPEYGAAQLFLLGHAAYERPTIITDSAAFVVSLCFSCNRVMSHDFNAAIVLGDFLAFYFVASIQPFPTRARWHAFLSSGLVFFHRTEFFDPIAISSLSGPSLDCLCLSLCRLDVDILGISNRNRMRNAWPNQSPEPTVVGAGRSAGADYAASWRWLTFLR
jgi:hypothetical protein